MTKLIKPEQMEKFDHIKAANGQQVCHRNGELARKYIGRFEEMHGEQKVIVIDWEGEVFAYSDDGGFRHSEFRQNGEITGLDLFLVKDGVLL